MYDQDLLRVLEPEARAKARPQHGPFLSSKTTFGLMWLGDIVCLGLAGAVTGRVAPHLQAGLTSNWQIILSACGVLVACFALSLLPLPDLRRPTKLSARLIRYGASLSIGAGALATCATLLPIDERAVWRWPLIWLVASFVLVGTFQYLFAARVSQLVASGRMTRRIALVGLNELSTSFLNRVQAGESLVEVVGLYRDDRDPQVHEFAGQAVAGGIEDILPLGRRTRIDAVVLALPLNDLGRIERARAVLRTGISDVYVVTGLAGLQFETSHIHDVASVPVVNISPRPLNEWQVVQKTIFDRVVAAILLFLLLPLLVAIALLIKCSSPGPVLFIQPRLGFNNRVFKIYKFRTMYVNCADLLADRQTTREDPRVTSIGRMLRRLSLDELPQLLNVLNGTMSLVGPRPHAPNTKAGGQLFHEVVSDYAVRHRVKPGITGWAQVNGLRGETKTFEQIRRRVEYDFHYIENWSLTLDLRILFLTLSREITSRVAF